MENIRKSEIESGLKSKGVSILIDTIIQQQSSLISLQEEIKNCNNRITMLESVQFNSAFILHEEEGAYVESIKLDATYPLLQSDGFHKTEYDGRGEPYVWTGPEDVFRFVFYISRKEQRTIYLNLMNFSISKKSKITPIVDGAKLAWSNVEKKSIYTTHEVNLHPRSDNKLPTVVNFQVENMIVPAKEISGSKDNRRLGTAFHSLSVS